ncbi:Geraniol 8-hydroxylase [Camellia lanceoleosa]|uniref:Geraniol 8-hydroxylase n=1 Tax=Camellia lanceoleosa TaxID=1840588 RepID=A0ACC0IA83_9ERIC|nr:Geraniol 8-hydroxylase [Camellia lanceoleosa]
MQSSQLTKTVKTSENSPTFSNTSTHSEKWTSELWTISSIVFDCNSSPLFLSKRNQTKSKAPTGTRPIASDRKRPQSTRQAPPVSNRASQNSRSDHESEIRPSNHGGDLFVNHGQRSPPKARSRLLQPIGPQCRPRPRPVPDLAVVWLLSEAGGPSQKSRHPTFSPLQTRHQRMRQQKVAELVYYARKCGREGDAVDIGRAGFRTTMNVLSNTIFWRILQT